MNQLRHQLVTNQMTPLPGIEPQIKWCHCHCRCQGRIKWRRCRGLNPESNGAIATAAARDESNGAVVGDQTSNQMVHLPLPLLGTNQVNGYFRQKRKRDVIFQEELRWHIGYTGCILEGIQRGNSWREKTLFLERFNNVLGRGITLVYGKIFQHISKRIFKRFWDILVGVFQERNGQGMVKGRI